jgi:hypothetical protein
VTTKSSVTEVPVIEFKAQSLITSSPEYIFQASKVDFIDKISIHENDSFCDDFSKRGTHNSEEIKSGVTLNLLENQSNIYYVGTYQNGLKLECILMKSNTRFLTKTFFFFFLIIFININYK